MDRIEANDKIVVDNGVRSGTHEIRENYNIMKNSSIELIMDRIESNDKIVVDNGVRSGTHEIRENYNISNLKTILQPLMTSMKCFGLAYGDVFKAADVNMNAVATENSAKNNRKVKNKRATTTAFFGKCLCGFVTLLLLATCCFGMKNIFSTSGNFLDILMQSIVPIWFLLCLCLQLICVVSTSRRQRFKSSKFGQFLKEFTLVKASKIPEDRRAMKVVLGLCWAAIFFNIFICSLMFYFPYESVRTHSRKMFTGARNSNDSDIATHIYTPIHAILSVSWILPTAYYVIPCLLVARRFNNVFERASNAIHVKKNIDLVSLRREHVQLCHVVSALDEVLSPLGLVSFAIYIPLTCINLNVCITTWQTSSIIMCLSYIFWIISTVTVLLVCSIAGAYVNNSAYRLSEVMYDINIENFDSRNELELVLLISNLNSNYTGLTVGGLVTVSKGMIITVFGTIIAYFTILIQFK
ncbi:hypothetical protein QZH41_010153 [Actinostola sp. cb2023]|nr:hypothetical protein QZH41_010153 [Actinostola sp. cb2023]